MTMSRRKIILIALAAAYLLVFSCLDSAAQVRKTAPPPIRQVDHIMIKTDDPSGIYAFFTETLRLPVAWPLATRGGVMSGGAGFGNTNVEAIKFPGQTLSGALLTGFGFEPLPLAECLAELDRRGVAYGEPRPFILTAQDGSKRTLFTNVTLRQFSDADRPAEATMHIFLSEYSPTYVDVEQRRTRLHRELRESGGGPLGVRAVKEVIVGATDFNAATKLWGRLLAPKRPSALGLWQIGEGPAIRVVRARESKLQGLVISVVSLRRARAFLQKKGLLGSVTGKVVTIDPSKIQGLNIRLVESK
jgi:catechol 2,3-dioxygenase-like lactoylglutathione lyase family enzyme